MALHKSLKYSLFLIFFFVLLTSLHAETLINCPKANTCNVDIYNVINTPLYKKHTFTLVPNKDGDGNNAGFNTQCARGAWIEANNRCEATPECGSPGHTNPSRQQCEHDPICDNGGEYQIDSDVCWQDVECVMGSYSDLNKQCESNPTLTNTCPAGTYNVISERCESEPVCSLPGVYNSSTNRCEMTVSPVCASGTYNSVTGRCEAAATLSSCHTSSQAFLFCGWHSNFGPPNMCLFHMKSYPWSNGIDCAPGVCAQGGLCDYTTPITQESCATKTCTGGNGTFTGGTWLTASCGINQPPSCNFSTTAIAACPGNTPPSGGTLDCMKYGSVHVSYGGGGCSGDTSSLWQCNRYYKYDFLTCPSGFTWNGTNCQSEPTVPACPSGYTQVGTLCHGSVTCPATYELDGAVDLCASDPIPPTYSCPDGYTLDGQQCVSVPKCPSSEYVFDPNAGSGKCVTNPRCADTYALDPNINQCTSLEMCGTKMTYLPAEDICIQEFVGGLNAVVFTYDGVEYTVQCDGNEHDFGLSVSPEIQNKIICTLSSDGTKVNFTLSLFDQGTYTSYYSDRPCNYDGRICNTDKDNPACTSDTVHQIQACKWELSSGSSQDLVGHGVPLGDWAVFTRTKVINLSLGFNVPEEADSSEKCFSDLNQDQQVQANELADCITTEQGQLCPMDTAECGRGSVPIVCPVGGAWDADIDQCLQSIMTDCADGLAWNDLHQQCEAPPTCPNPADGDDTQAPTCPGSGAFIAAYDACRTDKNVCPTGGTFDQQTQACFGAVTIGHQCPSGSVYIDARGRCEAAVTCPAGSYSSTNNRCELALTPSCTVGTYNNQTSRCEITPTTTSCHTSSQAFLFCGWHSNFGPPNMCLFHMKSYPWSNGIDCAPGVCAQGGLCDYTTPITQESCATKTCTGGNGTFTGGTWLTATCGINEPPSCNFSTTTIAACPGNTPPSGGTLDCMKYGSVHVSYGGGGCSGDTSSLWQCNRYYKYDTYTCPGGLTLDTSGPTPICYSDPVYPSCPNGYTQSGTSCYLDPPQCLAGTSLDPDLDVCQGAGTTTYACTSPYTLNISNQCVAMPGCPAGYSLGQINGCWAPPVCNTGYSYSLDLNACAPASPGVYNPYHDLCEAVPICPGNGVYNYNTQSCQMAPDCANGTWNAGAQRCESPKLDNYECAGGSQGEYNPVHGRCERVPYCSPGTYINHRCETGGVTSCPGNGTFNTSSGQCEVPPATGTCWYDSQYTDRTFSGCPDWKACSLQASMFAFGYMSDGPSDLTSSWLSPCSTQGPQTPSKIDSCKSACFAMPGYYNSNGDWCAGCVWREDPAVTCPYQSTSPENQIGYQCTSAPTGQPVATLRYADIDPAIPVSSVPILPWDPWPNGTYNVVCKIRNWYYGTTCPDPYHLDGNMCVSSNWRCPTESWTWNGSICYISATCPDGWALDTANPNGWPDACWISPTVTNGCPSEYSWSESEQLCINTKISCGNLLYTYSSSTGMCEYSSSSMCPNRYDYHNLFQTCTADPICISGSSLDSIHDVCAAAPVCAQDYTSIIHPTLGTVCVNPGSCPDDFYIDQTADLCVSVTPTICPYGQDHPCMNDHGQWKCSLHFCSTVSSMSADEDTIEGADDETDDGYDQYGGCAGKISIFSGYDKRCRQPSVNTYGENCCFTGNEDGCKHNNLIGFSSCVATELDLACRKYADVCVEVGTYCSSSLLSACLQRKTTYCCFNSKLGRLIQVQGRPQLKDFDPAHPFGSAKHPNCDGFTPEQFQNLNWENIDFTEAYPAVDPAVLNNIQNSTNNQINTKVNGIQP